MQFMYNDKSYEIVIIKKMGQKNTYIRVKKDLKVTVTTGYFVTKFFINNLIKENYNRICEMIDFQEKKCKNNDGFFYLGTKYIPIYRDGNTIEFLNDKVYIGNELDLDKWYKSKAKDLFLERLDYNYSKFTKKIPYPKLRIRKMTTRWGVCNIRDNSVTLNTKLIEYDIEKLDYVIIHELSHFIHFNHSKAFWNQVEKYTPGYKKIRKELKD